MTVTPPIGCCQGDCHLYVTLQVQLGPTQSKVSEKDLIRPTGESWRMRWESAVVLIFCLMQHMAHATQKYFLRQVYYSRC